MMRRLQTAGSGTHAAARRATALLAGAAILGLTLSGAAVGQKKPAAPPKPPKPIPGGANQVEGLNGKVGQVLFTGKWRFQVIDVQTVDSYTLKVASSEQDPGKFGTYAEVDDTLKTFKPRAGYTFVAVKCQARNAQKKVQQLDFYLNEQKTAIADDKENSHPPIVFDMQSKGAWMTKPMLPGSAVDMTILFAVPTDTKLKDLVVTLKNWEDSVGKEIRVSLAAPPAPPASAPAPAKPAP